MVRALVPAALALVVAAVPAAGHELRPLPPQRGAADVEIGLLVGDRLAQAGREEEARAAYLQAARLAPGLAEPRLRLTRLALDRGLPGEAVGQAELALQARPGEREARWLRARALFALGRGDEAASEATSLLAELDRPKPELVAFCADALVSAGHPAEASELLADWLGRLGAVPALVLRAEALAAPLPVQAAP